MTTSPIQHQNFHALIAAAGRGSRFRGTQLPKQYIEISGKSLLRHSIETFQSIPQCKSVRVIIHPDDTELYRNSIKDLILPPPITGSKERNLSVYNGLKQSIDIKPNDIIMIHDAARPCVKKSDILKLLAAMNSVRAATLATPISSTLRRQQKSTTTAGEIIERNGLWAMQTPQAFLYKDLIYAHENTNSDQSITDDTMLVSAQGVDVEIIEGSPQNIKITTEDDFIMAEKILTAAQITVSGIGFDVHAFDKTSPGPAKICGIDVPHTHKLEGHSDADVGLHALTDAILGAIAEGDIGRHFPPSDNSFKNMDSAIFLKHAIALTHEKAGKIINIDITLICEAPKITPYAEKMRNRISEITGLNHNRINIKATTTEQLGFTGRKEGIAAQALVTISLPDNTDG